MSEQKEEKKPSIVERVVRWVTDAIRFVTYDIWRITDSDVSGPRRVYIYVAKTLILAIRGYQRNDLQTRASALTYSTLLSVVPMLAVVVGVASGFGVKDMIEESLYDSFPSQSAQISRAFDFAQNYLSMTRGGVFLGIGLVLLLYTVFSLISTVEHTFNSIWQVEKDRTWQRKVTAYSAMIIILPVLMTISSGLSLFLSTLRRALLSPYIFLTPIADTTLSLVPYTIIILFFTLLYLLAPNTRVRFLNALVAGTLVGCVFQIFQYLYINGQIWVSKYNAIYGSFAALPLLMLWLQLSWVICLFGAELVHASQNSSASSPTCGTSAVVTETSSPCSSARLWPNVSSVAKSPTRPTSSPTSVTSRPASPPKRSPSSPSWRSWPPSASRAIAPARCVINPLSPSVTSRSGLSSVASTSTARSVFRSTSPPPTVPSGRPCSARGATCSPPATRSW